MYWPYSASRPCLMSTPPIHQKKALVAARSASSWSWPKSEPAQLAQLTWTFNASMMANPPPANGSTRSCAGKARSEEHTSELQSLTNLVCRLLLEKKSHKKESTLQQT